MHDQGVPYFELHQVGGALPVLVVTDTRHAGEADGYAVGGVHLRLGELRPRDLPHWRFLSRGERQRRKNSV